MCGIVAWAKRRGSIDQRALSRATLALRHRGPDHQQTMLWRPASPPILAAPDPFDQSSKSGTVGLGHTRLSVVDLDSRSNQPMLAAEGRYCLVYNGEIYNFRDVRLELEGCGRTFHTTSDTEVLLYSLIEWGPAATRKFNGMWAFAFFDTVARTILLSRDRYGKKPLYYWLDHEDFVAASEYKGLFGAIGESRRELDPSFVEVFLRTKRWRVPTEDSSAYVGVRALPPGSTAVYQYDEHALSIDRNNCLWDCLVPPDASPQSVFSDIEQAVHSRLAADVPVAVLISGGVDSSAVAAYAAASHANVTSSLRWYTGITESGNDLEYSRQVAHALQVPLVEVDVRTKPDTIASLMECMTEFYELPVWLNGNCIAMFQMYQRMAADGVRVVLDGTGGDEVFGGYFTMFGENVVASLLADGRASDAHAFVNDCERYGHCEIAPLLRQMTLSKPDKPQLVQAQMDFIETGSLPHWLVMNDINSMAHSVEARSPLLDCRLAKYISLPTESKFQQGFNKYLLRESLPAIVPDAVRWRRDKQGFRWTRGDLYEVMHDSIQQTIDRCSLLRTYFPEDIRQLGSKNQPDILRLFAVAELERVNARRRFG